MKKQLEIIHLRLIDTPPPNLVKDIKKSIADQGKHINIRVYHHATISTDLGFHIHLENTKDDPSISEFSARLVSALKEYGMVEHTVWVEAD
jgi:hypothetical protein